MSTLKRTIHEILLDMKYETFNGKNFPVFSHWSGLYHTIWVTNLKPQKSFDGSPWYGHEMFMPLRNTSKFLRQHIIRFSFYKIQPPHLNISLFVSSLWNFKIQDSLHDYLEICCLDLVQSMSSNCMLSELDIDTKSFTSKASNCQIFNNL